MIQFVLATIENPSDREFMEEVYENYHRLIYSEIGKYLHNHWDIEDVMQSVLLKLIDKIPLLRGFDRSQRINYIIVASRNNAFNYLRDKKRDAQFSYDEDLDAIDDTFSTPEDRLGHIEMIEDIQKAWGTLDERSRHLLEMKYILELSNSEIGDMIGVSSDSVRMLLTRARKKFRNCLESRE